MAVSSLSIVLVWLGLAPAEAEAPRRIALTYAAPEGCPGRDAFVAELERDLGGPVVIDPAAPSAVAILLHAATRGGYGLTLAFLDGAETQLVDTLEDATCDTLLGVAALQVSLALQARPEPPSASPPVVAGPVAPEASIEPDPAPLPSPPPPTEPPAVRSRPRRPSGVRIGGGIEAFGAGLHGLLGAALTHRVGPLDLELRGAWAGPTRYRLAEGDAPAVSVQLGTLAPFACYRAGEGRLRVPLCVGLEAGALRGRGIGIARPATDHALWIALPVRAGVQIELAPRGSVFVDAEAAPLLVRPGVRLRGVSTGYRAGPLSARLWAGVELTFGKIARTR